MKTFQVRDSSGALHTIQADGFRWDTQASGGATCALLVEVRGRGSIDAKTKQRRMHPVACFRDPVYVVELQEPAAS
jgi:hypothetical protein